MTAPDQFHADPEQIRTHASTVSGLAESLSSTGSGMPAVPPEGALGSFAQFFTANISEVLGQATSAVSSGASALSGMGSGLTQTAADYESTDQDNATLLYGKGTI